MLDTDRCLREESLLLFSSVKVEVEVVIKDECRFLRIGVAILLLEDVETCSSVSTECIVCV